MFIIFQRCYRVQYRLQNIIFWAGQAAPEVDLPRCAFTCPSTLLNKGEIGPLPRALPAGQVRFLFSLPCCRFLVNSLTTCNRASGYVACCTIQSLKGQMHHHDDLGSKCAYMCHLSNKTTRKSVLLSTPQIWLMKVSKKLVWV